MREWADVFVPALDERVPLEAKALFFIPKALQRCSARGISAARLSAISAAAPISGERAGRNVIGKVLRMQPVAYDSAIGFLNVLNHALAGDTDPPLTTADIVACVFRLEEVAEVFVALGLKVDDVARDVNVPPEVVAAAAQRYRLQLHDALKIWRHLRALVIARAVQHQLVNQLITDVPQDFIKTDVRAALPTAVKQLSDLKFVYRWENLQEAPRSGHHWAIEEPLPTKS